MLLNLNHVYCHRYLIRINRTIKGTMLKVLFHILRNLIAAEVEQLIEN